MKAVGRAAALLLLLAAMLGPWFIDSHPATEETCPAPLIWLGNGLCACLVSFVAAWEPVIAGQSFFWILMLLPTLPFLSTIFLIPGRGQGTLWIFHLVAWGLTTVFSLFFFFRIMWSSHFLVILWGAGSGGLLAAAMLAGEILAGKRLPER